MLSVHPRTIERAYGKYAAGQQSPGLPRWCVPTVILLVIGMTATALVTNVPVVWLLALVSLPVLTIASVPGVRYAAASFHVLKKRLTVWHCLLLLVFLSGMVFRERGLDEIQRSSIDAWALYRLTLMSIVALVLSVRLITGRTEWIRPLFRGLVGAMATYAVICVLSTAWSVFPEWTLYKSLEYLTDVAVIAGIAISVGSLYEYSSLFDWIWVLYGLLVCSVWVGAVLAPSVAFVPNAGIFGFELQGVMPALSSNGVGEMAAILGVVAFTRLILKWSTTGAACWYGLLLGVSTLTLMLSQSRSAVMAFLSGVVVAAFHRNARLATLALIAVVLAAFMFSGATQVAQTYMMRGQDPELFRGLSGRVGWWQYAWNEIQQRPWLGYGAYAGGRFVVLAQVGDQSTSSTHNSYIEVIIGCGIVGLLPFLIAVAGTWWQLARIQFKSLISTLDSQVAVEALSVLAVLTARSIFSVAMIWHPAVDFLIVLGYAELLRRDRAAKRQGKPQLVPVL